MAQGAPPVVRLAATVVKADGDRLEVTDANGKPVSLKVPGDIRIMSVATAEPEEIKPGSFVGSAARPGPDGKLTALEVHVFPPNMRGTGEGHRPWGSDPSASMTNGTVGDLVVSNGRTMTLKYGESGTQTIVVPPDVPVVTIDRGDRTLLVPGAHIVAFYTRGEDGTMTATRLTVGKDGTVPPM
ncbi:hypothetical protein [Ancylobacter oerskovii]|uniref:DUF5666 domain-containing protein n=1 Tax=Ancylobacter oerskovii TaxID=459519 RepID=A0ABW4Z2P0_9HYPH|nr:hypothetical protein [Ancylobacter oerskovii]MBS7545499.1 hypothetical protein [Ancylobacter oerskovii]